MNRSSKLLITGSSSFLIGTAVVFLAGEIHDCFELLGIAPTVLTVIIVPIYEEALKAIGALLPLRTLRGYLQSRNWGLYFGGMAGLGFGLMENLFAYPREVLALRSVLTLPLHVIESALVGLGIYVVYMEGEDKWKPAALFLLAIAIHATWNGIML